MTELSHRFASTKFTPFWAETIAHPLTQPRLTTEVSAELVIVGGGFTGLWSALKAKERHPNARVVVLEGRQLAQAASGRNGGFCAPSISHGAGNAMERWPSEAKQLVQLGKQNLEDFARDLATYGIEAEFERPGKLNVARTPWEVEGLSATKRTHEKCGIDSEILSNEDLQAQFNSPRYPAGLMETNYGLVNPAKLVNGLARACLAQGVEIYENSKVVGVQKTRDGLSIKTADGAVHAQKCILATNADTPLLPRLRSKIIPIYDYTIMTEPLSDAQLKSIGWQGRHGIADSGNQFHYSRKTADNRILWGGL